MLPISTPAVIIRPSIDVAERCREGDATAPQIGERIGERVLARPAHAAKWHEQTWAAPQAHEPKPAVGSASEHRILIAEKAKGASDVICPHGRDVAADNDYGSRWQLPEQTLHALPEIAAALRHSLESPWPERRANVAVG